MGNHDGIKINCPNCGAELVIEFNCDSFNCGWSIDDVDLPEVMGEQDD